MEAGLGDGHPKVGMVAARRRDDDCVESVEREQLGRVAAERGARSRAPGRVERCAIDVRDGDDLDPGSPSQHGQVHGPCDRAASDHADANGLHL